MNVHPHATRELQRHFPLWLPGPWLQGKQFAKEQRRELEEGKTPPFHVQELMTLMNSKLEKMGCNAS